MGRNTVAIRMAAPLKYLLVTLKVVPLEKVSLMIHKILRLLVKTLTVDEKHYLLTRDNSTQTIQIQLSQKQKIFREFFFFIFKIYIKF